MMTKNNTLQGHLAAFLTIFIWGTTFISTKVLLKSFGPIEILLSVSLSDTLHSG